MEALSACRDRPFSTSRSQTRRGRGATSRRCAHAFNKVVRPRCRPFLGGSRPTCLDSVDANDDGTTDTSDAIRIFGFLFLGGTPPAAPGPVACGFDETCVAEGHPDGVFFLTGAGAADPVVSRHCTIDDDTLVFFPIINTECSNVEEAPCGCVDEASCLACNDAFYSEIHVPFALVLPDGIV